MAKASEPAPQTSDDARFRDLAQRFVRVPKRDIDEARKRGEAAKRNGS